MELNKQLLDLAFNKGPVIIFIGQSGCGKETQSNALVSAYKVLHPDKDVYVAESGKLWRDNIPLMTTFSQRRLSEIQTAGKLQSWITTSALWGTHFFYNYNEGPVIVDGSPRTPEEAKALVDFYYGFAQKEIIVFVLKITDEEAEVRMIARNKDLIQKGKPPRSDTDTPLKRANKLQYFHTDVKPALESLKGLSGVTMYELNGMELPESVTCQVLSILSNYHST